MARDEAWTLVAPRVATYARRVTHAPPTVRLSNARSEWGSCNAHGEIRLNWRLVQLPPALAEYVVAHEVAHLVELNHSPRFWALVETLLPGHAALRRELEDWTALLVTACVSVRSLSGLRSVPSRDRRRGERGAAFDRANPACDVSASARAASMPALAERA